MCLQLWCYLVLGGFISESDADQEAQRRTSLYD